jgi:hypothetical protein
MNALHYAGVLFDKGGPVQGTHDVTVTLWDSAVGGQAVCTQDSPATSVVNGSFRIDLPPPCLDAVHTHSSLWVETAVDGQAPGDRRQLGAVPYAAEADHAHSATDATGDIHPSSITVGGTRVIGAGGAWSGPAPLKVGGCMTVPSGCGQGTFNEPLHYLDRVGGRCPADHPLLSGFGFSRCGAPLGTPSEGLQVNMVCCALTAP